jgi:hypothetical protein
MMKAGANRGATGENAIVWNIQLVDVIIGSRGIVFANGMMGEVTPKISEAVATSSVLKILLPLTQENAKVVGVVEEPLPHLVEKAVKIYIKEISKNV